MCPDQHQNKPDSKFCEFCGLPISGSKIVGNLDIDDATDIDSDGGRSDTSSDDGAIERDIDTDNDNDVDTHTDIDDDSDSGDDNDSDEDSDTDADTDTDSDTDSNSDEDSDTDTDTDTDDDSDTDDESIQITSITPVISTVISELTTWAKGWNVDDDPYVEGISTAASRNSNWGMWSALDATQLLPEMPKKDNVLHRLGSVLAIIRNVLVFLPVAITWEAIAKATDAYSKWDGTNPDNDNAAVLQKNFLDFWSNGYGILEDRFKIQHIGILDFWIIILIIFLSLISSGLISSGDKKTERALNQYETERLKIALKIRLALHSKREASPESIATSLADALADLNQTTRDMAEVAARLEAGSVGIHALAPQLEKLNQHAGTFAMQTSASITTAVEKLVMSVDELNNSVSSNITSAFQTAVSSLQEVGDELKRHASSVEYGTKLLKDDIESIREGLKS